MKEEIETNALGGMGSKIPRWELMDFRALDAIAQVFTEGAEKYAVDNWRAVTWQEHIRHAVRHLMLALEGGQQHGTQVVSNHAYEVSHGACRALMALAVLLQNSGVEEVVPKGLAAKPNEALFVPEHPETIVCNQGVFVRDAWRAVPRYDHQEEAK